MLVWEPAALPGGGPGAAAGYAQGAPPFGGFSGGGAPSWGSEPASGCGFGFGFGSMGPGFVPVPFATHMPSPRNVSVGSIQDVVRQGFNTGADKVPPQSWMPTTDQIEETVGSTRITRSTGWGCRGLSGADSCSRSGGRTTTEPGATS